MSARPGPDPTLPESLWAATAPPLPAYPPLEGERSTDLCIVGAGFAGLSAALHAAEAGVHVVLLEAAEPGWGAAGRNGGQVIPGLKLDPDDLEQRFGSERGRRLVEFIGSAPDLVFDLVARHQIDCSARREGWIHAVHAPAALAAEEARVRQWQARGAEIEMLDRDQVAAALGTSEYVAGSLDRRGGWLQPLAYARGLARAAQGAGACLHAASPATQIERNADEWRVETPAGAVSAPLLLICTNAYTEGLWSSLRRSLIPIVSYQVATRPLDDELRARILPKGQVVSDTRRLLKYFCMDPDGRLVMGGRGRLRETGGHAIYDHIVTSLKSLFPEAGDPMLEFYWSGRVALTLDHLPRVFALGPGLWAGGGYNGRGVAMATAMGKLLAECARGADAGSLPFAPTKPRPIPFHGLRRPAIELAVGWKRLLDAWETRQAQ